MEKKVTKLNLNQETLRNLTATEMQNVRGGFATVLTCRCSLGNSCGASQCTCPPAFGGGQKD